MDDSALEKAHTAIQETHLQMARKYRTLANRGRKTQSVAEGSLVWVRNECVIPGTSRKLNPKWTGPFKVVKVFHDSAT